MLEWLLRDASILDLMRAIGEHDYFSGEPLLVVSKSSKNGYFVVVEGNRRLCAVKNFLTNPNWLLSEKAVKKQVTQPSINHNHCLLLFSNIAKTSWII